MRFKKFKLLKIILKSIVALISSIILSIGVLFLMVYFELFGELPDKSALLEIRNEQASLVYSADNVLIGKYFAENRTNIKWSEIPEHLKKALIATEDKRFFSHKGYDTRSYLRVFVKSILLGDKSGGGGSTLTQQLIKNLYGRSNYGFLSLPINKIKELIIATRIEAVYNKEELLLLYLNSVPFGEDVFGIESASRRYFNKSARELKIEESAILVGLLKANTYFNPKLNPENSLARRNIVLNLMKNANYISPSLTDSLQNLPLMLDYENLDLEAPAGYFIYQVRNKSQDLLDSIQTKTGKKYDIEKDGLKIYTTLNMKLQEISIEASNAHLLKMQKQLDAELQNHKFKQDWIKIVTIQQKIDVSDTSKKNIEIFDFAGLHTQKLTRLDSLWHYYKMLNASILISSPKDGAVLCWIGGNHYRMLPFDMVLSHRQIASAFKPILYATALETGIEPCEYLNNKQDEYEGYKDWEPQNADNKTTPDSTVAFWYALAHSMNLPTIDLYFKVGAEQILKTCTDLQFKENISPNPSMALGALDVSLFEIVKAYSAFANKGQMNELVMINKITDAEGNVLYVREKTSPKRIFNEQTSDKMTALLQQVVEQGTAAKIRNRYGIKAELAGKTGTAQNYSDAWFISFTPDIVIGTWVGASTPDVHFYSGTGAGSSLALPISATIINAIQNDSILNKTYFTPFSLPEDTYSFLDCPPFRQIGIKGFLNRLFGKKARIEASASETKKNKTKKDEKKSFLKKLFKK